MWADDLNVAYVYCKRFYRFCRWRIYIHCYCRNYLIGCFLEFTFYNVHTSAGISYSKIIKKIIMLWGIVFIYLVYFNIRKCSEKKNSLCNSSFLLITVINYFSKFNLECRKILIKTGRCLVVRPISLRSCKMPYFQVVLSKKITTVCCLRMNASLIKDSRCTRWSVVDLC